MKRAWPWPTPVSYTHLNFEQMNEIEREVVQLFAQDVPDTPEVIGIGSSRVLQLSLIHI